MQNKSLATRYHAIHKYNEIAEFNFHFLVESNIVYTLYRSLNVHKVCNNAHWNGIIPKL